MKREFYLKWQMNRTWNGYMTVEASLIMPLVLAVIMLLLWCSFCLCNRCLGTQDAYLLCLRETQYKDGGNTRDASRPEAQQAAQFGEKYVGARQVSGTAAWNGNEVSFSGRAETGPGAAIGRLLLPQDVWNMSFAGSSTVRDPAYQIRRVRRSAAVMRHLMEKRDADASERTP